ncbi:uncharacterized protein V1518DRAFT_403562 [Limtongia smithiae]|uniref:uncharacterized protein n=1 Tax=Limtongia smithiae TaxID=1125753 RepID=UPI0034CF622B
MNSALPSSRHESHRSRNGTGARGLLRRQRAGGTLSREELSIICSYRDSEAMRQQRRRNPDREPTLRRTRRLSVVGAFRNLHARAPQMPSPALTPRQQRNVLHSDSERSTSPSWNGATASAVSTVIDSSCSLDLDSQFSSLSQPIGYFPEINALDTRESPHSIISGAGDDFMRALMQSLAVEQFSSDNPPLILVSQGMTAQGSSTNALALQLVISNAMRNARLQYINNNIVLSREEVESLIGNCVRQMLVTEVHDMIVLHGMLFAVLGYLCLLAAPL